MANDPRFTPAEILAMSETEMGKHMSGGYGTAKMLKMVRSIKDMAKALDLTPNTDQRS